MKWVFGILVILVLSILVWFLYKQDKKIDSYYKELQDTKAHIDLLRRDYFVIDSIQDETLKNIHQRQHLIDSLKVVYKQQKEETMSFEEALGFLKQF